MVSGYLARYPDVDIQLRLSDALADSANRGMDIIFRVGPLQDSAMVARPLPSFYTMVVCAAPSYLHVHGTPQTPHDLIQHRCLGHMRWGSDHVWRFQGPQGPVEVAVDYRLRVDQGPALRELALAGAGVILQPYSLVAADLLEGRLVRLMKDYSSHGRDLYMLYARDHIAPAKVRSFVEFALQRLHAPTL